MNVERVELQNFGSWAELDLAIEPGVSLISGANGAGKSTILQAVSFALFGVSSGAERLIRRGTDRASVTVIVNTDEGRLHVMRTINRSGTSAKVALSLGHEATPDGDIDLLNAATVGETQAILDGLLGVSREVLEASAFSMQHSGASFCEAAPRDRKRILTDVLPSLALWQPLADAAAAEKKAASDTAAIARAELERLDGAKERHGQACARLHETEIEHGAAGMAVQTFEAHAARLAEEAEAAREARRAHAAAVEQQQRAQADHARATAERATADAALQRAKTAAANAPSVDDAQVADTLAAAALGAAQDADVVILKDQRHWHEQLAEAEREIATHTAARDRHAAEAVELKERKDKAESDACPECGKPLDQPGDDLVAQRATARHAYALTNRDQEQDAVETWEARLEHLRANPVDDAAVDASARALDGARLTAHAAQKRLADAEACALLADTLDAFQQRARDASDREHETAVAVRSADAAVRSASDAIDGIGDTETQHAAAIRAAADARAAHSAAAAELARAEEAARVAERQAADETAARERLEVAELDAAIAGILAAGFGPTGVPAMIVDGILGDLSDEANRVLAELSSPIRVELRSQRLLKSADRLADTLDIVIHMDSMEAAYETLSGGERTRVAMALRAALTRLLASKSGARVKILVADEPSGLDGPGSEAFAAVLEEFVRAGIFSTVLLVTHSEALADQIQNVVRVAKTATGESYLVEAQAVAETPLRAAS